MVTVPRMRMRLGIECRKKLESKILKWILITPRRQLDRRILDVIFQMISSVSVILTAERNFGFGPLVLKLVSSNVKKLIGVSRYFWFKHHFRFHIYFAMTKIRIISTIISTIFEASKICKIKLFKKFK